MSVTAVLHGALVTSPPVRRVSRTGRHTLEWVVQVPLDAAGEEPLDVAVIARMSNAVQADGLVDALTVGRGVYIRGYLRRHQERPDAWAVIAVQVQPEAEGEPAVAVWT